MLFELLLLFGLIAVFIVSFCGLLKKIRQSYENDGPNPAASRNSNNSFQEIYVNPGYTGAPNEDEDIIGQLSGLPPSYTDIYFDQPPRYEDVIINIGEDRTENNK